MYNYFEKSAGLDPVLCRPKKGASRVEAQELEKKLTRYKKEYLKKTFKDYPELQEIGKNNMDWQMDQMIWTATEGRHENFLTKEGIPNVEGLKALDKLVNAFARDYTWTPNKFMEFMYLPKVIMGTMPEMRSYFNKQQKSNNERGGNQQILNHSIQDMIENLSIASRVEQGISEGSFKNKMQIMKDIRKSNTEYTRLVRDGNEYEVREYLQNNFVEKSAEGSNKILLQFSKLIRLGPEAFKSKQTQEMIKQEGISDNVVRAADIYYGDSFMGMIAGTKNKKGLIDKSLDNLIYGLKQSNHIIKDFGNFDKSIKQLEKLKQMYKDKDIYSGVNFATFALDLFPSIAESQKFLLRPRNEGDFNKGVEVLERLPDIVQNNIKTLEGLAADPKMGEFINLDTLTLISDFANNAVRANYVSYNTNIFARALKDLGKPDTPHSQLNKKIAFMQSYVSDMYSMNVGADLIGREQASRNARAITAFQFGAKMSSLRAPIRNAGQALQHYTIFGLRGMLRANADWNDPVKRRMMTDEMAQRGLEFSGYEEIFEPGMGERNVYNENTGAFETKLNSQWYEGAAENMAKVSKAMGTGMRVVENKVNRNWAFQLGFSTKWNADSNMLDSVKRTLKMKELNSKKMKELLGDKFVDKKELNNKERRDDWVRQLNEAELYEKVLTDYRQKRAGDYGEFAVGEVHYWYNKSAKPKILTSPEGAVIGQFQTYRANFWAYQYNIVQKGGNALMKGAYNSPYAWQMYRLGLLHTALIGGVSYALNVDFSNLFPNDTIETLENFSNAVSDDPKEQSRAFFGKGPIIGTVGGPFLGDLVTIGNIFGFYEMDEGSWAAYLAGYQDLSSLDNPGKLEQFVKLANVQLHRTMYNTYPKWKAGGQIGSLLQTELGLYGSDTLRTARDLTIPYEAEGKKRSAPVQAQTQTEAILRSLDTLKR